MTSRAALLLCAFGAGACDDDSYHVRWTRLTERPEGAVLGARTVLLPEGTTLGARPTVVNGGVELECAPEMESEDPDTLFVEPSQRGAFVFIGVSRGATSLWLTCGEVGLRLAGLVTEPPAPDEEGRE